MKKYQHEANSSTLWGLVIKNNHSLRWSLGGVTALVLAMTQTIAMPAALAQTVVMPVQLNVPIDRTPYDANTGSGDVSIPGGNEAAFSVRLAPGDYRVTATVGDTGRASRTTLWAEDRRLVAGPVDLKAGETRDVIFVVNVRNTAVAQAEQDSIAGPKVGIRGDEIGSRNWDDQLTVSASGATAAMTRLKIEPIIARRILLAGDSTVCDQAGGDYASWGQMLPRFVTGDVIANHARGGETMKSFLTTLRWDKLLSEVRPGDIVLIQFGHNDEKKQWPRTYAAADGAYPAYLAAFVADIRQHGAQPVLITPVARRFFDATGHIENSHGAYPDAVRNVAKDLGVSLIDLTKETTAFYELMGPERSVLAFGGKGSDKTHHNAYGAWVIASFVARDLAALNLGVTAQVPADMPAPESFEIAAADWPIMRTPEQPKQGLEVKPVK